MNIIDVNARVAIAFSLALIAGLLTYIAFFKNPPKKSKKKK